MPQACSVLHCLNIDVLGCPCHIDYTKTYRGTDKSSFISFSYSSDTNGPDVPAKTTYVHRQNRSLSSRVPSSSIHERFHQSPSYGTTEDSKHFTDHKFRISYLRKDERLSALTSSIQTPNTFQRRERKKGGKSSCKETILFACKFQKKQEVNKET